MANKGRELAAVLVFNALAATPAHAAAGLDLQVGEREADFQSLSGALGTTNAGGIDTTATLYTDPVKDLPLAFGVFYSQQRYSVTGAKNFFDSASVTELGPELSVWFIGATVRGFARVAQTIDGTFTGSVNSTRTLATGAGTTTYAPHSSWSTNLSGPHFSGGAIFGGQSVGAGLMVDVGMQRSTLRSVTVNGKDETDAFSPYMRTDASFNSTALLLMLQGRI